MARNLSRKFNENDSSKTRIKNADTSFQKAWAAGTLIWDIEGKTYYILSRSVSVYDTINTASGVQLLDGTPRP